MSSKAGETTPLKQTSGAGGASDDVDTSCCGCDYFRAAHNAFPKPLRFPFAVLRFALLNTCAAVISNMIAMFLPTIYQNDDFGAEFAVSIIYIPLWPVIDLLGLFLLYRALAYGNKKAFAGFVLQFLFLTTIEIIAMLGFRDTGFAGVIAAEDLNDLDKEVAIAFCISGFVWAGAAFFHLYGFIHLLIALRCCGGMKGLADAARKRRGVAGDSMTINAKKGDTASDMV